eukprot:TRINITY_DN6167_c0_g2_i1.p1 TRINITY_DN6167_c0_g2~~TRINITY_DN6167_c0_g2_i1.p1  ORF type:complete len:378 (+),score=113.56 TRINITY_DN6167_c0_g2_i1:92-1135(+)
MATWAAAMSDYCKEKCGDGPPLDPMHRFTRVAGGLVREQERSFHPVLQKPIKPEDQETLCARESEATVRRINRGMARELTRTSYIGFNPINQEPKFGIDGADRMGGTEKPRGRFCPGVPGAGGGTGKEKPPRPSRAAQREYNIIQHRYRTAHEERMRARDEATLEHAGRVFCHGRDPVLGMHNDGAVEEQLRAAERARDEQRRAELHATTRYTPHIVRRSEGHNYDIIKGDVFHDDGTYMIDRVNRKGVPMRTIYRAAVSHRIAARDEKGEVAVRRAANRKSHPLRLRDMCRSGYDILTGSRAPPAPEPAADESPWRLLARTAPAAARRAAQESVKAEQSSLQSPDN